MKQIYVIGNGFDIDLGWRTSYKDFYDSHNGWKMHRREEDDLFQYVIRHTGENWYDFERTIYEYCLEKSKGDLNEELMNKDLRDFRSFKSQLENFVKERSKEPVNRKSKAYEILKSFIEQSSHTNPSDLRPQLFSFNYTPLGEVAIQIKPNMVFNYTAVHGTIEKNNCIFGFQDDINIKGDYRYMQKSLDDNYDSHGLLPTLMDARKITFFGLSMGPIDAVYFKDVFDKISTPGDFNHRKMMEIEFITKDAKSKRDIKLNLQSIGINIQSLMQNNKVTFTLTSDNNK